MMPFCLPQFPCACPPFSRPVRTMVALPAPYPHYVIPCSNLLDPAYVRQLQPGWPFPRAPWPFESETRAPGTGLLASFIHQPCVPPPCPPTWTAQSTALPASLQRALAHG